MNKWQEIMSIPIWLELRVTSRLHSLVSLEAMWRHIPKEVEEWYGTFRSLPKREEMGKKREII